MSDLIKRLRSNSALPICPFDKRSPEYYTTPNDKPCKFCGGEPEGPDKCTGADMRIMSEAADEIERLTAALSEARKRALESAANVASMWASRTATEANALRKLRDYARAKQLASEAEGATRIAAAIRSLME